MARHASERFPRGSRVFQVDFCGGDIRVSHQSLQLVDVGGVAQSHDCECVPQSVRRNVMNTCVEHGVAFRDKFEELRPRVTPTMGSEGKDGAI